MRKNSGAVPAEAGLSIGGWLLLFIIAAIVILALIPPAVDVTTGAQFSIEHAIARHGDDARRAMEYCRDPSSGIQFMNPITGRWAQLCSGKGEWGFVIREGKDDIVTAWTVTDITQFVGYVVKSGFLFWLSAP